MSWEIALVLAFIGVALILVLISRKIKQETLKILCIFLALSFLLIVINVNYSIVGIAQAASGANQVFWDRLESNNNTVYILLTVLIILIALMSFFYYLILFILKFLARKKEKEEKERGFV